MNYHNNKVRELYNIIKDDINISFNNFKKDLWSPLNNLDPYYYSDVLIIFVDILYECDVLHEMLNEKYTDDDDDDDIFCPSMVGIVNEFVYYLNKDDYNNKCRIYYRQKKLNRILKWMNS